MIAVIQTYLPRHEFYRSIHDGIPYQTCRHLHVRYLIRISLFFFLYSELVWIVEKRTENKTKAMEEECEREWERERHFNQCIAYNGCDSHKYRLVFLSHGENDKYKRGAGASFFFWHIPYLRMFLLLMNIFFFYFFIIIMLFFLAQAMAIISRHRFYVE